MGKLRARKGRNLPKFIVIEIVIPSYHLLNTYYVTGISNLFCLFSTFPLILQIENQRFREVK